MALNETHNPARESWVSGANIAGSDFPIQNLPFGIFSTPDGVARGGVALGDQIIDLRRLADSGLIAGPARQAAQTAAAPDLLALFDQPASAISALRAVLSRLYSTDYAGDRAPLKAMLVPADNCTLHLPARPRAFTDFCCSIEHIRRMGAPMRPAWTHIPVGYNGRAGSVRVSGTPVIRPMGMHEFPPASGTVRHGPERFLDFELEFGVWLTGSTRMGQPLTVAEAEDRVFGYSLVNDWSARTIQFFESALGPHLGKSFLTTVSPWIVTREALEPFRVAARGRASDEPAIAAHLFDAGDRARGSLCVDLTAELSTEAMRDAHLPPLRIVSTNFSTMFWTFAQMIAHLSSNGCPLDAGDLVASGTVSGPADDAKACLAEINGRGTTPLNLPTGETRSWLADGDELVLRGQARGNGYRPIGFGSCAGHVLSHDPAVPAASLPRTMMTAG